MLGETLVVNIPISNIGNMNINSMKIFLNLNIQLDSKLTSADVIVTRTFVIFATGEVKEDAKKDHLLAGKINYLTLF